MSDEESRLAALIIGERFGSVVQSITNALMMQNGVTFSAIVKETQLRKQEVIAALNVLLQHGVMTYSKLHRPDRHGNTHTYHLHLHEVLVMVYHPIFISHIRRSYGILYAMVIESMFLRGMSSLDEIIHDINEVWSETDGAKQGFEAPPERLIEVAFLELLRMHYIIRCPSFMRTPGENHSSEPLPSASMTQKIKSKDRGLKSIPGRFYFAPDPEESVIELFKLPDNIDSEVTGHEIEACRGFTNGGQATATDSTDQNRKRKRDADAQNLTSEHNVKRVRLDNDGKIEGGSLSNDSGLYIKQAAELTELLKAQEDSFEGADEEERDALRIQRTEASVEVLCGAAHLTLGVVPRGTTAISPMQFFSKFQNDDGTKVCFYRPHLMAHVSAIRAESITAMVRRRVGLSMGNIVKAMLQLSKQALSRVERPRVSISVDADAIFNETMKFNRRLHRNKFDEDFKFLQVHPLRIVERVESSRPYLYHLRISHATELLQEEQIASIIGGRFGHISKRIWTLLRRNPYLDQKQIHVKAMYPFKETKAKLYELFSAGFLHVQEVPRTSDHSVSRTFHLWFSDIERVTTTLLQRMLKTQGNLTSHRNIVESEAMRALQKLSATFAYVDSVDGLPAAQITNMRNSLTSLDRLDTTHNLHTEALLLMREF